MRSGTCVEGCHEHGNAHLSLKDTHGSDVVSSGNGRADGGVTEGEEGKENSERAHDSNESGREGVSLCIGCVGNTPRPELQSEGERDDGGRRRRDEV